jgi:hypothetical protein
MHNEYQSCIDLCSKCAMTCDHCAASCMKEPHVTELIPCIRLDLECVAICRAAIRIMILESNHANAVCQLCADICIACAEECEKHDHDHCRECAAVCRECAAECMNMTAA